MTTTLPLRVLLVEDSEMDAQLLLHELRRAGFALDFQRVDTEGDYLARLNSAPDVILADYHLPQFDALRALHILREQGLDVPLIVVTGAVGDEAAVECLQQGAVDFLLKDRLGRLGQAVKRALEQRRLEYEKLRAVEELRASEAALVQRVAELAETDRRKNEFLAMLGHELRNPLAPILYAVALLQIDGVDRETLREAAEAIERQSQHMARLLDDLLDVSRIMCGKIELRKQRLNLDAIVRDAVEASQPLIESGSHQLSISLDEPLSLEADPTRLAQVVTNLLNNAARYTEQGGRIWIDAKREANQAVLRVRDSGIGMDGEMLARIFEPFVQGRQSLARTQGGLGIGLSMVRSLVEMHGGSVTAASAGFGHGSEFTVRLPLAGTTAEAVPLAGPISPATTRNIVLVEDNDDSRTMLGELLRLSGHEVWEAADGLEGVELIRRHRPDVALIDIGLPGLDGYQVARRLHSDTNSSGVFLVALTGYGQPEDRRRALDAGFDAHLVKPVMPDELLRVLSDVRSDPIGT